MKNYVFSFREFYILSITQLIRYIFYTSEFLPRTNLSDVFHYLFYVV